MGKTMKKVLCTLMMVIMSFLFIGELNFGINAFAAGWFFPKINVEKTGRCGDNVNWSFDEKTGKLLIVGTGDMWDFDYQTSPFYSNDIKTVVIEEGVASIGEYAFYSCKRLGDISLPDSITSISGAAFYDTAYYNNEDSWEDGILYIGKYLIEADRSITSCNIKDGTLCISEYAFYDCISLGSVTIPDSVTCIGGEAFSYCNSLASVTVDINNKYYSSDSNDVLFNKDKTKLIQYPTGNTQTSYVIPDSVKSIDDCVFFGCTSLESVIIPDSVTSIGYRAFSGCTNLTNVTIPDSVVSIGSYAFEDCTSLTSATIPNSVTSIGVAAFEYCTSLTSVTIPVSVTSIGDSVFYNCTSLTSITIPDSVASIGGYAFYDCCSLNSITIPDSVTSIGECAFYDTAYYNNEDNWEDSILYIGKHLIGADNLITSCDIKDGTLCISESSFSNCESLASITIPDSVTSIGYWTFWGCKSLVSVTIPDSVTSIGSYAFYNCTSLTSVTIPDKVTSIGRWAFYNCTSLTSVTIPDSVTSIGDETFSNCDSLTSVIIPDSVTSIGYGTFSSCGSLTSVIIPDSVTSVGESAFWDCYSLTSITIPDSVKNIGYAAFWYCNSLTSITVDENNTNYCSIDGVLFNKDKTTIIQCPAEIAATNYTIPDGVTSIGDGTFRNCTSLESITIPDSVTSIGYQVFYDCTSLTNVTIPDSVTSIDYQVFYDCTSLTNVTIPDGVTSIGSEAFYDCTSLTNVTIPGGVTDIGENAFYGTGYYNNKDNWEYGMLYISKYLIDADDSITSCDIKIGTSCIGDSTFSGCTSLEDVTIPDSVTSIGYYTFFDCISLENVTIPDSVTSIDQAAFCNCTSLESVTIPDSVTSIGYYAFDGCDNLADVYYNGTKEDWKAISIVEYNDPLLNATIHFISDDPSHTHTPKTITISASCTVDGMTYQVCSECGEPIGTPTVIPAAHTPGDWEVDIEPTYEAEGKEVIKCTVCHKILESKPIPKLVKPVITDEDTGIKVEYNDSSYDGSVDMTVTETFDGSAYQLIDTIGATSSKIYDITITVDGEETQPNGKVTVKIPLPAGYNPDHSYVYHVNTETGAVEKMPARYEDGYMVFETDHFSYYAVIEIHEHTFSGSKCTVCGYDRADSCSCNCHASGIAHFFFVIVNFFQKLFGNNKVCACGAKH